MEVMNKYVTIKHHIDDAPKESDFELRSKSFTLSVEPGSNDVIVRNLYLSIDPYQINRMKKISSTSKAIIYSSSLSPGQTISAYGIGRVVASVNPEFEKDDVVEGLIGWEEYSRSQGGYMLRKTQDTGFPLSYHVGILGLSGLAAHAGFYKIGKPKKGEKVFVSAASGSVGNLVGQFAKLFGCYVVGCAGSQSKVDMLKNKLGFDDAFNYKEESDLKSTLKRYFPEGIDIYFDNVGSEMLEAAVDNMNDFGRVAVCGAMSEYTNSAKRAALDMVDVVYKRLTLQGFLAADNMDIYADFVSTTTEHLRRGEIQVVEDISQGLESIPSAFAGLFRGDNMGKKMIKIVED